MQPKWIVAEGLVKGVGGADAQVLMAQLLAETTAEKGSMSFPESRLGRRFSEPSSTLNHRRS